MSNRTNKCPFEILLVEDAEPDVLLVREALHHAGLSFRLHVLKDGEDALRYLDEVDGGDGKASGPHLILLDLNLPKRSGGEVLERLRRSPRCSDIPVVVLTSSDSPRDRAKASHLRATAYFRKPSRLDDFMSLGVLAKALLGHVSPAASVDGNFPLTQATEA